MSSARVMKFVKLYREKECLWKINSETYKNRDARDEALQEICSEMNIDGFGIREVAQKIKNIRSSYYQEIKKIANSKISGASDGDIYKPRVPWFSIVHSFLKKNPEINETESNLHSEVQSGTTSKRLKKTNSSDIDDTSAESSSNEKGTDEIFKVPSSYQASSSKKRRFQDRCIPPSYITEAIEKLDSIQSKFSKETEFDVWCRSLAKQLNNMETWRALDLQMKIQTLVSRERIVYEKNKSYFSSENDFSPDPSTYKPSDCHYNYEPPPPQPGAT